jgi:uroporphyrin-III C-methyltransferase
MEPMPDHRKPKLTLVGAGPGDPEYLTLRALNVLRSADIVLHDALVSEGILNLIPRNIPIISVGKRAGAHSVKQDEINSMILECCQMYKNVVRLKGGDPFVFGRGMEEIEFATKHDIETAIVSGISSAIAVPAALGIPVTARGVSESFWVVTGTTMSGAISHDIRLAAQSTATVVILMGLNKIEEIMHIFSSVGKAETPVAVVQNGTLPSQQAVVGTVSTIVDLVGEEKIKSPALIIVGEVVRHARQLQKVIAAHDKSK